MPNVPAQNFNDSTVTVSRAAKIVKVSPSTLRRLEESGEIKSIRLANGYRVFKLQDLNALRTKLENRIGSPVTRISVPKVVNAPIEAGKLAEKLQKTSRKYDNARKLGRYVRLPIILASLILAGTWVFAGLQNGSLKKNTDTMIQNVRREIPLATLPTSPADSDVLGQRDRITDFRFDVNIPTNLGSTLTVVGEATLPSIGGVTLIDTTTLNTFQGSLTLGGDVVGPLGANTIAPGVIDGTEFASEVSFGGTLNLTGELQIDEDSGEDGQILSSTGSGLLWIDQETDAETLGGLEANQFLRSNVSDTYESGTLSFADGTFLDLSDVLQDDSTPQGFRLPQGATLANPSSGEGYLAYDTDDDRIYVYNGTTWANVIGATMQETYEAGNTIVMTALEGDVQITNDALDEILFLDESSGFVGIGTATPSTKLEVVGDALFTNNTASNTTINLTSTGDFTISDAGTPFITFNSAGNVVVADDVLFDLSAIVHNDNSPQGFKLPQATSFTAISGGGEGYLAWDSDDNIVNFFDGTSWQPISGTNFWSDSGTLTYLTSATDDFALGGSTTDASLYFDTSASALSLNPFGIASGETGEIRFEELEANGDEYTGFKSPNALAANVVYTLPPADAITTNQVLSSNSAGVLAWIDVSAGAGSLWSDSGAITYLTSVTDDLAIGGTLADTSAFFFDVSSGDITFEGSLSDGFETTLVLTNPTADQTITIPDSTGTICLDNGNCAGGAGGTKWTDSGTTTYLTDSTDELVLGGTSPLSSAKFSIDGDADQIQLIVQGFSTQTSDLVVFENSVGSDQFNFGNTGNFIASGNLDINGSGTHDIAGTLNLSQNTLTSSGDLTITPTGGDVTIAGSLIITDALNGGGLTAVAYNSFANAGEAPEEAAISSDNDLYIGGDLEVDGVLYGVGSGLTGINADTLDSLDSLQFLRSDTSDNFTSGTLTTDAGTTLDVNGDLAVADTSIAFDGASTDFAFTGDWTVNTDDLFVEKSTGNVGIGMTNPVATLDVAGTVNISSNSTTDDTVKTTTADFTVSGSTATNVATTGNQVTMSLGTATTTVATGPTLTANVSTGSHSFQRPDGKFVTILGNSTTTTNIYDPATNAFTAGPTLSVAATVGAHSFQRPDGKFVVIHSGGVTSTSIYDPGANTFSAGPVLSAAAFQGSHSFQRPDGKFVVIHGNNVTTTSIYDPSTNAFTAGPALSAAAYISAHTIQRPDGMFLSILGGNTTASSLYNPATNAFTAGPTLNSAVSTGGHSFQRPDGKFVTISGFGTTSTNLYDPNTNTFSNGPTLSAAAFQGSHSFQRPDGKFVTILGANTTATSIYDPTTNTYSAGPTLTNAAGNGSHSFQRPDGKFVNIAGQTATTTNLLDLGWNTSGSWQSEPLSLTKLSSNSTLSWNASPEQSNNRSRIDQANIIYQARTTTSACNQTNLDAASYVTIKNNGDLIPITSGATCIQVLISMSTPIPSNPSGTSFTITQSNVWMGESNAIYFRTFQQPTVYDLTIGNPTIIRGGGDPPQGQTFAQQGATLENVFTDNTNRLALLQDKNVNDNTTSRGVQVSLGPVLTATAGAGAHSFQRPDGKFVTILGNSTTTTNIYDPATNAFTAGPALTAGASTNAHSFQRPDGKFVIILGSATTTTNIYDPATNAFTAGPALTAAAGAGLYSFQRLDGKFVIILGGGTATNIYDPATNAFTAGPALPASAGAGAHSFQRPDGRFVTISATAATATNIYDPTTNAFTAGPALTAIAITGAHSFQRLDGKFVTILGGGGTTTNIYDPATNAFTAGPALTAGASTNAHSFQRPDGKFVTILGNGATTTNIYDPATNAFTAGPALTAGASSGAHSFQRPDGKFVTIRGAVSTTTNVLDLGWNLSGTYITEQINDVDLNTNTALYWKNTGGGNITVKVRTASSATDLGLAAWSDVEKNGSLVNSAGDTWIQLRFDLVATLPDYPGAQRHIWIANGLVAYYRTQSSPILYSWKLTTNGQPSILTLTSGGLNVFRFNADGSAYTNQTGAWYSGGADVAEYYSSTQPLDAGEVVIIDPANGTNNSYGVLKSSQPYQRSLLGIVSTQPGFVAGAYLENGYPIALSGRVPVKVDPDSTPIEVGDFLTSSAKPGLAMKAIEAGYTVGKALESWTPESGKAHVEVFVGLGYYNPNTVLVDNGITNRLSLIEELLGMTSTEESSETTESSASGALSGISSLVSDMLGVFSEFQDFVEALGMGIDEETNTLTINANLLATGDATFNNATLTGDLSVGFIQLDSLANSIDILGPSCISDASGLNQDLCEAQALHLQKNLSGNVDVFNGKIVLEPNGTINLSKLTIVIDDPSSPSAGVVIIPAGQVFIIIETKALTPNSLILATPNKPVPVGTEIIEPDKFKVNLSEAPVEDIKVDWLIVDAKTQTETNNP